MAAVDLIPRIPFDTGGGYNDDDYLGGEADWDLYDVSGGDPRIDIHTDHKLGQVVDCSDVGVNRVTHVDTMTDPDHWVEITSFLDIAVGSDSGQGVILRGSESAGTGMDGYGVFMDETSSGQRMHMVQYENGSPTVIGSSTSDLDTTNSFHGVQYKGTNVIRGQIIGTAIKGYSNGEELVSTTDGTYTTGGYVGFESNRGDGDVNDQPFVDDFTAGVFAPATPHTFEYEGGVKQYAPGLVGGNDPGTSVSATFNDTPTSGNLLVAMYFGMATSLTAFSTLPSGFTEQLDDYDVSTGVDLAFGLATKTSDGTESGAFTVGATPSGDYMLILIELEPDWALDDVVSAFSTGSGSPAASIASATLTAGDHLAISAATSEQTTVAPSQYISSTGDNRFLIPEGKQVDGGGNDLGLVMMLGDIGTGTTAHTFSVTDTGSSGTGIHGVVFYKAAGGGELTELVTETLGTTDALEAEAAAGTTNPLGTTDALEAESEAELPDTLGVTDTVEIVLGTGHVVVAVDGIGLTDAPLPSLDIVEVLTDDLGLLDVDAFVHDRELTLTDVLGLLDQNVILEEEAESHDATDPLGAVDSTELAQDHVLVVIDGLGATDLAEPVADQGLTATDDLGGLDVLAIEDDIAVVEALGLLDPTVLLEEEAESHDATDLLGVTDNAIVDLTIGGTNLTETVTDGLDSIDTHEDDQEQEIVEAAGLSDSAILLEEEAEAVTTSDDLGTLDSVVVEAARVEVDVLGAVDPVATEVAQVEVEAIGVLDTAVVDLTGWVFNLLVVQGSAVGEADLSWNTVDGATGYNIERDGTVIETNHTQTSYTDSPLTDGVPHKYRVQGVTVS